MHFLSIGANNERFDDAVTNAVNLGDDADNMGTVAGQIAGAIYDYSGVPKSLKDGLVKERHPYVTSQFLSGASTI